LIVKSVVDGVVPLGVEGVGLQLDRGHLGVGHLDLVGGGALGELGVTSRPVRVMVAAIGLIITSSEISGLARQLRLMKLNRRCSTLFHLLVPGGKWQT
jgi:hypothetical protein